MKHYNPINLWAHAEPNVIPSMSCQRHQFDCANCGKPTFIAVPNTYADWESVANDYKHWLQKVVNRMNQAIADIELIHGPENPVTQFYRNKWAMLALEMQAHFGSAPKGTSARARDEGEDMKEGWKQS